jgi:hypothetical protein
MLCLGRDFVESDHDLAERGSASTVNNARHDERAGKLETLHGREDCFSNGIANMKQLFSKADVQVLCSVLAVLLLLNTLPLGYGAVIVSSPNQPQFATDICSPIQILVQASNTLLARPATNSPRFNLFFTGPLAPNLVTLLVERSVTPETPPPKQLV